MFVTGGLEFGKFITPPSMKLDRISKVLIGPVGS